MQASVVKSEIGEAGEAGEIGEFEMAAVRQCLMTLLNKGRALLKVTFINTSNSMLRPFFVVSFIDRYNRDNQAFSAVYWPVIFHDFATLKRTICTFLGQYSVSTAFLEGMQDHESTATYQLRSKAQRQRSGD
jgi:hypothetical protein